jgi:hypothetical protein
MEAKPDIFMFCQDHRCGAEVRFTMEWDDLLSFGSRPTTNGFGIAQKGRKGKCAAGQERVMVKAVEFNGFHVCQGKT